MHVSFQLCHFLSENRHIFVLKAFPILLLPPLVLPGSLSLPGALLGVAVAELAQGPWGLAGPTCILIE